MQAEHSARSRFRKLYAKETETRSGDFYYLCRRIPFILHEMLLISIITLGLAAIAADWLHCRRRGPEAPKSRLYLIWIVVTDLLPFAVLALGVLSPDNTSPVIMASMWMVWAWMAATLPRLVYYTFNFFGWRRTGMLLATALAALLVIGATAGRTRLRVSHTEVCSAKLPEAFDGARIVQISDLHLGTIVRPERELTRLANRINALQPDWVVFTGDLVNIRAEELDDRAARLLGRIKAPVYSVTGNHDVGAYIKDSLHHPMAENLREVIARQRAMGWNLLDDETRYLHRGRDSISLTGLSFDPALRLLRHKRDLPATGLERAFAGVPTGLYNLTLVHVPQLRSKITAAGYGDLVLSGHVHAMQCKVRPWGRGWSPAALLYREWSGRYEDSDGKVLYINDGIGCVGYPMRLGARPEITLITLKRCE